MVAGECVGEHVGACVVVLALFAKDNVERVEQHEYLDGVAGSQR